MSNRYQIKEKLTDEDGRVFRGFDTHLKRNVAITRLVLKAGTEFIKNSTGFLSEEASIPAQFQHPNVVTIFGFEEDKKGLFVVSELIKGESLKRIVESDTFTLDDFQEFVSQSLDAMIAAEQMNLLHGEIHPSNLLLRFLPSGKFHLKILNFGLEKFCQPSSESESMKYQSPERIRGESLDQRSDLYSLGCVCYFALTREPPFENAEIREVTPISGVRPDLPPAIAAWVMRMIAADRENRPQNAMVANQEFEQAKISMTP